MSSEITRGGKNVRPSFNFFDHAVDFPINDCIAQLLESTRNVLEDIRFELRRLNDKQMLQRDVRADIKKGRLALQRIARRKRPAKRAAPAVR